MAIDLDTVEIEDGSIVHDRVQGQLRLPRSVVEVERRAEIVRGGPRRQLDARAGERGG